MSDVILLAPCNKSIGRVFFMNVNFNAYLVLHPMCQPNILLFFPVVLKYFAIIHNADTDPILCRHLNTALIIFQNDRSDLTFTAFQKYLANCCLETTFASSTAARVPTLHHCC